MFRILKDLKSCISCKHYIWYYTDIDMSCAKTFRCELKGKEIHGRLFTGTKCKSWEEEDGN